MPEGKSGEVRRRTLGALLLALTVTPHAAAAEFLRRARPLEEIVGRLDVRRSRMAGVPVPVDCPGARQGGCFEEQTFDEVARFDFFLERSAVRDGAMRQTEAPSGTILVAANFSDRDRIAFWDAFEAAARRLAAEAFASPDAGWKPGAPPFDGRAIVGSSQSFWGCFESGATVIHFTRPVSRGGAEPAGTALGTKRYSPPPPRMCEAMKAATGAAPVESRRTLPSPLRTREEVVELRELVRLTATSAGALHERPAEAVLRVQAAPAGMRAASGPSATSPDEARAATRVADGKRYDAEAGPAEMPWKDLASGSWLSEWNVRTMERVFGLAPREEIVESTRVLVAILATPAPGANPAGSSGVPAPLDREALLARLGEAMDRAGGSPAALLEDVFLRAGVSIPAGWVPVVCRQDGSAFYALPPTEARGRVTNATTFCRALDEAMR